jgi:hypothetical protein
MYRVLVEKPWRKRPLGRPRHRWEDNIQMDIQEVDVGMWTGSSRLRIGTGGGICEFGNGPSGSIKCGEFLEYLKTG